MQFVPIGSIHVFMYFPYFQSGTVRIQISQMHGVTMSQPGAVKQGAVVINGTSPVHNLIFPITIHVTHTQVMIPLVVGTHAGCSSRIIDPSLNQFLIFYIVSSQHSPGVISAAHHHAGMHAIQVRHTGQKAVFPVPVIIAPPFFQLFRRRGCGGGRPWRDVGDRIELFTGLAAEEGQVFGTTHYNSFHFFAGSLDNTGPVISIRSVGIHQHIFSLSIDRTGSCFTNHFGYAVAIKVIHHKLGVVCTSPDIPAQVNAPELCAVQLIRIQVYIAGETRL